MHILAVPIKMYLNGDKDARKFIQEDDITICYMERRTVGEGCV